MFEVQFRIFEWVLHCQHKLVSLSPVILLFVKICLSIFLLDVWDKLWVLIRPVPEVFLLI